MHYSCTLELDHINNPKNPYTKQRHVNKMLGSFLSKLHGEILLLGFGCQPKRFMESLEFFSIIFAQLPSGKSTGPSEFNFFNISPLESLNLVLIPGVKLDGHRGTWTGCLNNLRTTKTRKSVFLALCSVLVNDL